MGTLNQLDITPFEETYLQHKEHMRQRIEEARSRLEKFKQKFPEPTIDDAIVEHILTHDQIEFRNTVIRRSDGSSTNESTHLRDCV
jgi:23S rRNA C2498 (ribose-2'-O)-methylase RlmM